MQPHLLKATVILCIARADNANTSDLDEHREDGLLEREAEVLGGKLATRDGGRAALLDEREQPRERHVHTLHHVRQLEVLLAPILIVLIVRA